MAEASQDNAVSIYKECSRNALHSIIGGRFRLPAFQVTHVGVPDEPIALYGIDPSLFAPDYIKRNTENGKSLLAILELAVFELFI